MKSYPLLPILAFGLLFFTDNLQAQIVIWPPNDAAWTALPLTDPAGDENPRRIDIVGTPDRPAAFYAFGANGNDENIFMLRMRIRQANGSDNNVWQYMFSTDGDPSTIQWVLQIDTNNDDQVELRQTSVAGNTFGAITLTEIIHWNGSLADYSRRNQPIQPGGGQESTIGNATNVFFDVAIPWDEFTAIVAGQSVDTLRLGITVGTSTNHNNNNKDYIGNGQLIDSGTDVVVTIPEPSTALLLFAGLAATALRRKRGSDRT